MPGLDDLLARLSDEYGVPEDELQPLKGSSLRKKLEDAEARAAKAEELERELSSVRKAPLRLRALEEAGVIFDQLRPAELRQLESFDWEGDKPSEEEVSKFISEWGLPVKPKEQSQGEGTAAGQIGDHAAASGSATPQSAQVDYSKATSMEDLMVMYRQKHGLPPVG